MEVMFLLLHWWQATQSTWTWHDYLWPGVSLTWLLYNLQRWRYRCWFRKFSVCFWPIRKEIVSSMYNNMGYWPSVRTRWLDVGQVLFFACLWTETESRSINKQKKTSLVNKGFIMWLAGKFFLWDMAGSAERARKLHLACSGSQSQCRIWFILPAHGTSHIIIVVSITQLVD